MQRALDLEPLEPLQHAYASQIAFQARNFAAAIAHPRTALAIDSQFWIAYLQIAQAREGDGAT
jgi:hypothetical protein